MRIVVTGSRDWPQNRWLQVVNVLMNLHLDTRITFLGVGDARGVDEYARWFARREIAPENWWEFKADWDQYNKGAGHRRNGEMLRAVKPDLVLAFLVPSLDCRGTWDCIEQAQGMKIRIEPYRMK